MTIRPTPIAAAIGSLLACSLLAACGGGGGGMVRNSPAPQSPPTTTPPPSAPPPASTGPCPAPVTADCLVTAGGTMLDGRSSTHRLILQLPTGSELRLGGNTPTDWDAARQGVYTFGAGTLIESGGLVVVSGRAPNSLASDVEIRPLGELHAHANVEGNVRNQGILVVGGEIKGNVDNAGGQAELWGRVSGNFINRGRLLVSGATYGNPMAIGGDFTQEDQGIFTFAFAPAGWDSPVPLQIAGQAQLAGTLELVEYADGWGSGYPLPLPGAQHLLHAAGGVFGTFDRWTSPGLFIEGNLRYGAYDVWFDLTRISLQAAMAGQGFGGITLASAANLDRALAIADGFATAPNASQSRFLRSAGRLLWLDDARQAARSLDSLSGSLHVAAMDALANDDALVRGIGARTLALQPGDHAGAWSRLRGGDTIAGFDQWLSPRLLAGATAAQARDARSDHFGGHVQQDSPQAALYLRWFGNDGWYAGGTAGYAQHALALDRRIDLADGGQWNAHVQRRLGIASVDAEAGRRFGAGGMTIAPYLWLGADVIHSEGAIEQGQTGFELTLQANAQASLDAGLGVRVGQRWRVGETGWLAFHADARYRQRLAQAGGPLRAAFIGVPDAWFDVPGHEAHSGAWLDLGLRGGFGHGWAWSLGHAGSLAGQANVRQWQIGLARKF